jgi:hypothetical protein
MKIPEGAQLLSVNDESVATVIGPKKILFRGEETSLTGATKEVLGVPYAVNPGPHWTYEGRTITDIYNETYSDVDQ